MIGYLFTTPAFACWTEVKSRFSGHPDPSGLAPFFKGGLEWSDPLVDCFVTKFLAMTVYEIGRGWRGFKLQINRIRENIYRRNIEIRKPLYLTFDYSNSIRGIPDCRIIDWSVPILITLWLGTGTVIVLDPILFCIIIWLPFWRILEKPCIFKILQTSAPESPLSLGNWNL